MKLTHFLIDSNLVNQTEIEKVRLLAFYHYKLSELNEFTTKNIEEWFEKINLAKPNISRLKQNLLKSKQFVRGTKEGYFKLPAYQINLLDKQFPSLTNNEEVQSDGTILPETLYSVNKGYIESLAKQINASYEHNIFDGCAVLMRRLLEILLIQTYEHLNISSQIQDSDGNYFLLEKIEKNAITNSTLSLSRNSKGCISKFRELGNFSAHKIYYTCKPSYIEEVILNYRATIEELLYKSGLKI